VNDIGNLLGERQKSHGSYSEVSSICQSIKRTMRMSSGWNDLTNEQAEALEMIAMKVARILSGNSSFADHWEDIEGYARLVSNELERERVTQLMEQSMRDMIGAADLDEEREDDEQPAATTDSTN
jgi:C4-type Zn-finger protein